MSEIVDLHCVQCKLTFGTPKAALKHQKEKHLKEKYNCLKCKLTFKSQMHFRVHWNKKHVTLTFSANEVNPLISKSLGPEDKIVISDEDSAGPPENASTPDSQTADVSATASKRRLAFPNTNRCPVCRKIFQSRAIATIHYKKMHIQSMISCSMCHLRMRKSSYKAHWLKCRKNSASSSTVEENSSTVNDSNGLNINIGKNSTSNKCQTQIKSTTCPECGKPFKTIRITRIHYKHAHVLRKPTALTNESALGNSNGSNDENVNEQCRKRKRSKPYTQKITFDRCSVCKEIQKTRFAAIRHYKAVHSINVYMCPHCDLGFNYRDTMMTHWTRIHKDIPKPNQLSRKKRSKEEASNETDSFPSIQSVTQLRYKIPNLSIRSNVCPICKKHFSSIRSAQDHFKWVHRREIIKCPHPQCFARSNNKHNLRAHIVKLHPKFAVPPELQPQIRSCKGHILAFTNKDDKSKNDISKDDDSKDDDAKNDISQKSTEQPKPIESNSIKNSPLLKMFDKIRERNANMPPLQPVKVLPKEPVEIIEVEEGVGPCFTLNLENCSACKRTFRSRNDAIMHYNQKHPDEMQTCPQCENLISSSRNMQYHWKTKHPNIRVPQFLKLFVESGFSKQLLSSYRSNKCEICFMTFDTVLEISGHLKNEHDIVFELCAICLKGFTNKRFIKLHWMAKHKGQPFTEYDESEGNIYGGVSPKSEKERKKPLVLPIISSNECPECKKTYETRSHVVRHYKIKHLKEVYKCNQCGNEYVSKGNLKFHWNSVHGDIPFSFTIKSNAEITQNNTSIDTISSEISNKTEENTKKASDDDKQEHKSGRLTVLLMRLPDNFTTLSPKLQENFFKNSQEILNTASLPPSPQPKGTEKNISATLEDGDESDSLQKSQEAPLDLTVRSDGSYVPSVNDEVESSVSVLNLSKSKQECHTSTGNNQPNRSMITVNKSILASFANDNKPNSYIHSQISCGKRKRCLENDFKSISPILPEINIKSCNSPMSDDNIEIAYERPAAYSSDSNDTHNAKPSSTAEHVSSKTATNGSIADDNLANKIKLEWDSDTDEGISTFYSPSKESIKDDMLRCTSVIDMGFVVKEEPNL